MASEPLIPTPMHTEDGKFAKGHPFCGNNPIAAAMRKMRSFVLSNTDPNDVLAVVNAMRDQALMGEKGSAAAAAIYLAYTAGKPDSLMSEEEAKKTFDVQNLNKKPEDMTPIERRARLQQLLALKAVEQNPVKETT